MTISAPAKIASTVAEVLNFMRERGLTLADLIEISGEDLKSSDPTKVEKARRVEKCWNLMVKLCVKFADIENLPSSIPDRPARRRRGEGVFSEVVENKGVSGTAPYQHKSNEIKDLADSAPVGELETNPGSGK